MAPLCVVLTIVIRINDIYELQLNDLNIMIILYLDSIGPTDVDDDDNNDDL